MISININESKKLRFKISLSGVQPQDLKGSMRIVVEGMEYGFPIKIDNGDIVVEVSPISKINNKLKDGSLLDAKLELIAIDTYLIPWQDKIKIKNPIKVEAKIEDIVEELSNLIPKVDISVSSVYEEEEEIKEEINEKKIEKKIEEIKKKSKFHNILEQDEKKCPEGEKY